MDIWILIKSGLQSLLSNKKHKKQSEKPINEDTWTEEQTEIKVHKILAGPFSNEDDPEFDPDYDEPFYWIEVLIECQGEMEEVTIMHDEFDKIYDIVKHMGKPIVEPFIIGGSND